LTRRITISDVLNIPYSEVVEYTASFIQSFVEESGAKRVVMGLSGGVDSATLLALLVKAIGSENVTAMIMPDERVNTPQDVADAVNLARDFGVEYYYIPINGIVDSYSIAPFYDPGDKLATGNLRARVRMNLLYYYANKFRALVAGSSDRSEILIGYFTKYGDGAADFLPLGSLYKTQVRMLALKLGLPDSIAFKPSSPGLWPMHYAEEEIGVKYEDVDLVLYALIDLSIPVEKVPEYTGLDKSVVERVLEMHRRSKHKRRIPPTPTYPWLKNPLREV